MRARYRSCPSTPSLMTEGSIWNRTARAETNYRASVLVVGPDGTLVVYEACADPNSVGVKVPRSRMLPDPADRCGRNQTSWLDPDHTGNDLP